MTEPRVCVKCNETKDLSQFRIKKATGTIRTDCRTCENKARRDRDKQKKKENKTSLPVTTKSKLKTDITQDDKTGIMTVSVTTQDAPADPRKFLISRGVNPDDYTISGASVSSWPTPMKLRSADGSEAVAQVINFRVEAKITPKKIDPIEFGLQEFKWSAPTPRYSVAENKEGLERVIVIPDIHFGYRQVNGKLIPTHDPKALALSLKLIEYVKPDKIVLNGDTFDWGEYGRHPHGMDIVGHMKPTLNAAVEYFNSILEITDCDVHLIPGNHDVKRLLFGIQDEVKKLSGIPGLEIKLPTMSRILGLDDKRITYHGETTEEGWDGYTNGQGLFSHRGVVYLHGEKCGKNAVEQTMDQYYSNISMGHLHKFIMIQRMVPQVIPTGNGHNHEVRHVPVWGMCPGFLGSCNPELPGMTVARNYQKGIGIWNHVDMSGGDWTDFRTMPTLIPINDNCLAYNDVVMSV